MKHYKAGQFVTINHKLARVCKRTLPLTTCDECIIVNKQIGYYCNNGECLVKLGLNLYPKFIKQ